MPLAPFVPRPLPGADPLRRGRLAVLLAVLGILAAVLAYAVSPSVRHEVKRVAHSVSHAVTHVFKDNDRPAAPALPTSVLVGPAATLKSLAGHPALVTFWAPACAGCATQAHAVERFAGGATGSGRVVGVDVGGDEAAARRFVRHHRWTFTNLRDATGAVARKYGIKAAGALPMTYAIDASGHIAATVHGPLTQARMAAALRTASR